MRVAFLRSVDIKQALPSIANFNPENHYVKLFYTDGYCEKWMFPGDSEKLESNISCDKLLKKIINWHPDVVISTSVPDDKALRDSIIRDELWRLYKIPMIMHPMETTLTMCNKWETSNSLRLLGFKTPKSFLISTDLINNKSINYLSYRDYIKERALSIDFPVIIKPLCDSMSCGIKFIKNYHDFIEWFSKTEIKEDFIFEQFIPGELLGMEIVGCNSNYICQPLVKKCSCNTDNFFPFNHVRFGPVNCLYPNVDQLEKKLLKIAKLFDFNGTVEFEIIYYKEEYFIIEINPRISGMTNLSSSISGLNTYQLLFDLAVNKFDMNTYKHKNDLVFEIPLVNIDDKKVNALEKEHFSIIDLNDVEYHNGVRQHKMLFKAKSIKDAQRIISILDSYRVIQSEVKAEVNTL